ncbi:hypothetical protein FHS29_004693 [Saccharothrix tamanrassetensis]|uniref:Uncharacterized protein n=1 Tax=Saccharothrix tamanrassetensis TaxID=1051531 RepID=A0A841CQ10_9PSEU|nr:hypothetical protein [Saccharothrix tamanrassetensis]
MTATDTAQLSGDHGPRATGRFRRRSAAHGPITFARLAHTGVRKGRRRPSSCVIRPARGRRTA